MTIYYVRASMGNDSDDGETPAAAFLTVDKAANTVVAGDIVWIGGGVYRETVTIDTSGTSGSEIEWRGDVDGAITGDAGLVQITVLADEVGAGGTGNVLLINGKEYNEFYNLILGPAGDGSTDTTIEAVTGNANYQGILFDNCVLIPALDSANHVLKMHYNVGAAIAGNPLTFQDCFIGGAFFIESGDFTVDVACGIAMQNCTIMQLNKGSLTEAIKIDGPSSCSYGATAFSFINNTFIWGANVFNISDQFGTGTTGSFYNNLFPSTSGYPINLAADSGAWVGDYNICAGEGLVSGTTGNYTGGGDDDDKRGLMLGLYVESMLTNIFGSSPYKAWEQVWDHLGAGYKSGGIDTGGATYAPASDIYGNARPMGRTLDDAGAVETRRRPEKEETTVKTGSLAAAFKGAGYHDITLPVAATSTTVSVYARYDSNHTGDKPILEVLNIPGDTDKSDAMTGSSGTWEEISCTFTPTSAGTVRVRLRSRDSSSDGVVIFDDLTIT